jgi:hypothetical protein
MFLNFFVIFFYLVTSFHILFAVHTKPKKAVSGDKKIYTKKNAQSLSQRGPKCDQPIIFLLGDSTMAQVAQSLSQILDECTWVRRGGRCKLDAYYGMSYNYASLRAPIPKYNGPIGRGVKQRGCLDCSGCEARKWICNDFGIEHHGIEFASDVEFPALKYHSTQETIILGYLSKIVRKGDFVVFNTGLHDTATTGKAPWVYARQLDHYLDMILSVFPNPSVRWVTTTYPESSLRPLEWRNITNPEVVSQLNNESRRIMSQRSIEMLDVAMLSSFNFFKGPLQIDGLHMGNSTSPSYVAVAFSILIEFSGLLTTYPSETSGCNADIAFSPADAGLYHELRPGK